MERTVAKTENLCACDFLLSKNMFKRFKIMKLDSSADYNANYKTTNNHKDTIRLFSKSDHFSHHVSFYFFPKKNLQTILQRLKKKRTL